MLIDIVFGVSYVLCVAGLSMLFYRTLRPRTQDPRVWIEYSDRLQLWRVCVTLGESYWLLDQSGLSLPADPWRRHPGSITDRDYEFDSAREAGRCFAQWEIVLEQLEARRHAGWSGGTEATTR